MKLLRSVIVVGIAVLSSGCIKEPTGKDAALQGRFSLEVVVGSTLPLVTYDASLSQAKIEVLGAELVTVSRSRMLDIVEYQATSPAGVKEAPYKDTISVAYTLEGSALTITRQLGSETPSVESWILENGVVSGVKSFRGAFGIMVGPFSTLYTVVE